MISSRSVRINTTIKLILQYHPFLNQNSTEFFFPLSLSSYINIIPSRLCSRRCIHELRDNSLSLVLSHSDYVFFAVVLSTLIAWKSSFSKKISMEWNGSGIVINCVLR